MAPLGRFLPVFLACIRAGILAITANTKIAANVSISSKGLFLSRFLVLLGSAFGRCLASVGGRLPLDVAAMVDVCIAGEHEKKVA